MAIINEKKTYNICSKLLDKGQYIEAIKLATSLPEGPYKAGIYIDGGFQLADLSKIRKGIGIFENMFLEDDNSEPGKKSLLAYNIANGYFDIFVIKESKGKNSPPPNDDNLRKAKKYYKLAIENIESLEPSFSSQVHINYGNCLSKIGRFLDAIEQYKRAIFLDPTNGMGHGNLGIELEHALNLTGQYMHEYIVLSHHYLKMALDSETDLSRGSPNAHIVFSKKLDYLTKLIDAHKDPILKLDPETNKAIKNDKKLDYLQFCINNGLFLNAWAGDKDLTPGIVDDISFGEITTDIKDDFLVPELLRILNEIKESYATARYLLFLSQKKSEELDKISKISLYFYNFDYSINSIYLGLCKTAYARAFDILDKVARIINKYYEVGNERVSFWNTLTVKHSRGEEKEINYLARDSVIETNNYCLYALSDLCIDYFEDDKKRLQSIDNRRNLITHEYLNVKMFSSEDQGSVSQQDLYLQTKEVLQFVKCVVMYVVSSINSAEKEQRGSR